MAFINIPSFRISGMSASIPSSIMDNSKLDLLGSQEDIVRFLESTHIRQRYVVGDSGLTTADLCENAASRLLDQMGIDQEKIEILIFVTQTPDYHLPSSAIILQHKLGLSKDCIAIQISLGCSGWVYGLSTVLAYMSTISANFGLLLVGDTVTMTKSPQDKGTYPLFGDAGTATLIERKEGETGFKFHLGNDGSGHQAIIIEDGGYRNPVTPESLIMKMRHNGVIRNNLQSYLNGQDVFIFGITKAPFSIKSLMEHYDLHEDDIDYLILHQANKMMNDKIAKKAGFSPNKVPFSLHEYGNTSSASIPLTMVSQLPDIQRERRSHLACGFGVGLSWGSVHFETENLVVPEIIKL